MSKVIASLTRWLSPSLVALFALSSVAACTTTSIAPSDPHLTGRWQLDAAASDNPDAKISAAIDQAESKLRKRLANAGYSQYDSGPDSGPQAGHRHGSGAPGGGAELNGDEYSQTGYIGPDFDQLHRNLQHALASPATLTIDVKPDSVRLAGNGAPPRDYPADDTFTRIDEYGTARIDTNWSGTTFNLRARYANRATVTESYTADAHAGTLTVTRHLTDPVVGKLVVRAVYHQ
jgi:hypothetical protein